jgi:PAS domain S-box
MKRKILEKEQLFGTIPSPQSGAKSDFIKNRISMANQFDPDFWSATFNAIEDAVSILDSDFRFIRSNKAMQKFAGLPDGDLVGKHCYEILHQTEMPIHECPVKKMQKSGQRETTELQLTGRWYEVTADPMFDSNAGIIGAIHILRDVTSRRKAEEKLKEREKKVSQKLEFILSPELNIENLELADVINSEEVQKIMEDFYRVSGLCIGIVDLSGKVLVANGWQDICTRFHRVNPDTCKNCNESDTILSLPDPNGASPYKSYKCKNNMWDISTPIIVGGKHLGNIFIGQFLYEGETPDYDYFRNQAKKYGFDEHEYIAALDKVPRLTHETIDAVMSFYSRLSALISNLSYTNLKLAKTIEERDRAVSQLESNYSLLRMAGKAAKFGGWSLDISKKIVTWSEEVAAIHDLPEGYSPTLAEGIDFYTPEWKARIEEVVALCVEKGVPYDEELEIYTAKGKRIWVRTIGEPVYDKNGRICEVNGAFQNIQERKVLEAAYRESEGLLNLFMKHTPVYTYIKEVTPDKSTVVRASENFSEMIGIPGSKMQGKNMFELFPEEFARKMTNDDWEVITAGKVLILDEELNDRNYTTIKFPIPSEKKKLLAGFSIDDTERKQIEREVKRINSLLSATLEATVNGIVVIRKSKLVSTHNNRFIELWQIPEDIMETGNYRFVIERILAQLNEPQKFLDRIGELLISDDQVSFDTVELTDGRIFEYYSHAQIIDGEVFGRVFGFLDVTKRKEAEKTLLENEIRLKELNATKDRLFSIIAHDLRNPFNSILGFSNLIVNLIQEKDYAEIERYAQIIQESSEQALDLLQNLLEWSRAQVGRLSFDPANVDLVALVNLSAELLSSSAMQKSISIVLQTPVNLVVYADKAMINTVLRNLISNAIKFSFPGGLIEISLEVKGDQAVFSICDDGMGIDSDDVGKLFRKDKIYSTFGTQREKGTGLGLLLCKEFIDIHNGKIWVESEKDKGSKFYFSIPLLSI